MPIDQLRRDLRNAREHSDAQIRQIARSIQAFGFIVPILIDQNGCIVAGHGRYEAAILIGLSEISVIQIEHLTEAQVRAFKIADNRLTDLSDWNEKCLAETLNELRKIDLDFSIEVTGFSMAEIDLRIQGLATSFDAPDKADEIPKLPGITAVTEPGDCWRLGPHVVYCGNALDAESYRLALSGGLAHLIFSDPPYNVPIVGHAAGRGRIRHRDFSMAVGELGREEFTSFLMKSCALMVTHSTDGAIHFLCMDWRHLAELLEAGRLAYSELKNVCVWVKDNGGMGSFYRSRHEFVAVFKSGTGRHRNNIELGRFGRNRTNVWEYPCANTFSRQSDEGRLSALHPTVKPVQMVADAILDCSARGDVVLDPFLGSGTTLMAAERVGRKCRGIEIDPLYVDVVVRRWQAYTGDEAVHALSGRRFDDIAGSR